MAATYSDVQERVKVLDPAVTALSNALSALKRSLPSNLGQPQASAWADGNAIAVDNAIANLVGIISTLEKIHAAGTTAPPATASTGYKIRC